VDDDAGGPAGRRVGENIEDLGVSLVDNHDRGAYGRVVGLRWSERIPGRAWDGIGAGDLVHATVDRCADGFVVYIEPRGCGVQGGLWLGGGPVWATLDDATEAADRHVVAFTDSGSPSGLPGQSHDVSPRADDPGRARSWAAVRGFAAGGRAGASSSSTSAQ
jgi:hypothetical protein